jgi:hypothetical protein
MKQAWFKPWGWIYRPVSVPGFVLLLLTVGFCAQVFLAVDRNSHSVSDTLYGVFPFIVPSLIVLNWVASRTSADRLTGGEFFQKDIAHGSPRREAPHPPHRLAEGRGPGSQ